MPVFMHITIQILDKCIYPVFPPVPLVKILVFYLIQKNNVSIHAAYNPRPDIRIRE